MKEVPTPTTTTTAQNDHTEGVKRSPRLSCASPPPGTEKDKTSMLRRYSVGVERCPVRLGDSTSRFLYNPNDKTLSRNSLVYMSKANLPIAVH